jgi:hypothetical protein
LQLRARRRCSSTPTAIHRPAGGPLETLARVDARRSDVRGALLLVIDALLQRKLTADDCIFFFDTASSWALIADICRRMQAMFGEHIVDLFNALPSTTATASGSSGRARGRPENRRSQGGGRDRRALKPSTFDVAFQDKKRHARPSGPADDINAFGN